ncbi:hypothetical protein ACFYZ9_39515 [Streptomyces sp. NPDC001691]|uniref:hypothetical protein n=1 Tax=Streptomyces sp. NPDC001691 TaxID=3364600 RepID=UPI00367878E1
MRSLLRIAVAATTLLLLGLAVAPGTARAADGDEHVARIRLRVVDAVNEGTRAEIERMRARLGEDASGEVARLEHKLREGCRLAADLRAVREVRPRASIAAVPAGSGRAPAGDGGRSSGESVFQAARTAIPHTPTGVLSLVGGGALALVGGGVAAAVTRRPRTGDQPVSRCRTPARGCGLGRLPALRSGRLVRRGSPARGSR